jgi:MFS family permease
MYVLFFPFFSPRTDFFLRQTALPLSLYLLGYCAGPFLWSPLSESYGRRPFFLIHGVFFTLFTGVCAAAPSYGALLVLRFISGFFGAVAMTKCVSSSSSTCSFVYPNRSPL